MEIRLRAVVTRDSMSKRVFAMAEAFVRPSVCHINDLERP